MLILRFLPVSGDSAVAKSPDSGSSGTSGVEPISLKRTSRKRSSRSTGLLKNSYSMPLGSGPSVRATLAIKCMNSIKFRVKCSLSSSSLASCAKNLYAGTYGSAILLIPGVVALSNSNKLYSRSFA